MLVIDRTGPSRAILVTLLISLLSQLVILSRSEAQEVATERGDESSTVVESGNLESHKPLEQSSTVHSERPSPWIRLFGRLHPAVVHFPIGLIIAAAAFELLVLILPRRRSPSGDPLPGPRSPSPTAVACLTLGAVAAALAAWTGWENAEHESHSASLADALTWHRWLGVAVVMLALTGAFFGQISRSHRGAALRPLYRVVLFPCAILAAWGGHVGGTMVYGDDYYLTVFRDPEPASSLPSMPQGTIDGKGDAAAITTDPTRVVVIDFDSQILPIFTQSCTECHGPDRKRGKLRLDSMTEITKRLDVISPGNSSVSDLVRRLRLSPDHEDYMPQDRPPLLPHEIDLISRWVESLATDSLDQGSLPQTPQRESSTEALVNAGTPGDQNAAVVTAESAIQTAGDDSEEDEALANPPIESEFAVATLTPAQQDMLSKAMSEITARGGSATILGVNSQAVDVNCSLLAKDFSDLDLSLLTGLEPRLRRLSLAGTAITDAASVELAAFTELKRLDLSRTSLSDSGLATLASLPKMESLNLFGTDITDRSVEHLARWASLRRIYVWNTQLTPEGIDRLRSARPELEVIGAAVPPPVPTLEEPEDKRPECCRSAESEGHSCDHPCCVESATRNLVCAKCLGG